MHSIRNDAQHKAKYPNLSDLEESEIYTNDFCNELILNTFGLTFSELSTLDWIVDPNIKLLLNQSIDYINSGNLKKAATLTKIAFDYGKRCLDELVPRKTEGLYPRQINELSTETVEYISSIMLYLHNDAKLFSTFFATGISFVEFKKYKSLVPSIGSISYTAIGKPKSELKLNILWHDQTLTKDDVVWLLDFVSNAIINWQSLGLTPKVKNPENDRTLSIVLNWDEEYISVKN